ncbi:ATP-binding cassette domain-containing protein [Vagococcus entomophilus]|uniref:ATP-binding cassette domain-containing protein n=1 Tax=Vagococcus entomophilus TaxID=1160095 RepID=UPI002482FA1F|nr:ATP-binding cassette domain-containing protein [Vagococcus entomophilus]
MKSKEWKTTLYENGANLSGGEKQRIAICRTILNESDLYILDESISNIDYESGCEIMNFLMDNASDKIIIFTSHDKKFKKFANKIISL